MWVALVAAFVSAAVFAASSAVQQRVAGGDSSEDRSGARLLLRLSQEPRWWLGLGMSAVAFALHAFALSKGMLAVVQPIIVSGLVFAVFARAAMERQLPPRRTIVWCSVTWVGLAAFIAVVHTSPAQPANEGRALLVVVLGLAFALGTLLAADRIQRTERRGLVFAAGAGVLFGLVAGLVKVVVAQLGTQWWLVATHWPVWALAVVGVGAILLNQRAFQATRLSVSMPMVNIMNVMVAIAFGFVVFGERLFSSPVTLVVELLGLAMMGLGVSQLASRDDRPADHRDAETSAADTVRSTR